jgi:hypothetical protein
MDVEPEAACGPAKTVLVPLSSDAVQLIELVDDQVSVKGVPNTAFCVLATKLTAGCASHRTVTCWLAESGPF